MDNISYYLQFLILFIVLLASREFFTYKKILYLKYFLTPLVTLTVVTTALYALKIYNANTYNILTIIGLILALTGDTLMMIEEADLFIYGLLFFFLTQIAYILAFAINYQFKLWNIAPALLLIIFIYFFYSAIKTKTVKYNFPIYPVLIYMTAIAVMFYFSLAQFNNGITGKGLFISTGAFLFVLSDIIIAVNKFIKKIPNSTIIVWSVYAPAQMLIGLSNYYM